MDFGFEGEGSEGDGKSINEEQVDCCMARLLGHQDDFTNQISQLETLIRAAGHECIFFAKFHCELNPIEMASTFFKSYVDDTLLKTWIVLLGLGKISLPRNTQVDLSRC